MSIITSIGTAVPPFKYDQGTLCEFMGAVSNLDAVAQRKLEVLYAKSAIDTRYAALPDFANAALQDSVSLTSGLTPIDRRSAYFGGA